jgi:hypothetical protein
MELHPVVHNYYLNIIKKLMGASFVSWVQDREGKYLKIIVDKKPIPLPLQGGDLIGEDTYKKLINEIIKIYGGGNTIQETVQLSEQESGIETVDAQDDGGVGER